MEKTHVLGLVGKPTLLGWLVFIAVAGLLLFALLRNLRSGAATFRGVLGSLLSSALVLMIVWLLVSTLGQGGRPGTLIVTLLYVFVGIFFQYTIGLVMAMLTTQRLPGRRFFRVIFLLPMMITPVGIAYTLWMLVDTDKGPIKPILQAMGLGLFSWVNDPWLARAAIMFGDIWQWTPFMFIVLLAALEGQSVELAEAAKVDGANRWQIFWYITLPQILPVSTTLILIRMIESFKIVDLPNILTNGGPGTATESLTLQAFFTWRALDLGSSAAIAYTLLFLVTFIGISYVNLVRSRVVEV
jgi:multiple sugar transport system permease protein